MFGLTLERRANGIDRVRRGVAGGFGGKTGGRGMIRLIVKLCLSFEDYVDFPGPEMTATFVSADNDVRKTKLK